MCKLAHNWFDSTPGSMVYHFYHIPCLFDGLKRCRTTTPVIDSNDEIANFENIPQDSQTQIDELIIELRNHRTTKKPAIARKQNISTQVVPRVPVAAKEPYKGDQLVILHSNADVLTPDKKTELLQLIQLAQAPYCSVV